jgi:hypothetical protein
MLQKELDTRPAPPLSRLDLHFLGRFGRNRDLMKHEREYVVPRVAEIERMEHVLANTKEGGSWTNMIDRQRRARKREMDLYFFERNILTGNWVDDKRVARHYTVDTTAALTLQQLEDWLSLRGV